MTIRRYGDDEVREIFSLATTGDTRDRSLPVESGGMTLDELQRIGQEAGIEPEKALAVLIMFGGIALAAFAAEHTVRLLSTP